MSNAEKNNKQLTTPFEKSDYVPQLNNLSKVQKIKKKLEKKITYNM